jgi:uncharacterized membrane protein HdeD (DUF308 family)
MAHLDVQSTLGTFITRPLMRSLADKWWLLLLRGIAALIFGVLAFALPGLTILSLTFVWGAYALADGLLSLGAAISGERADMGSRWWLAAIGIIGVLAGAMTFLWPGVTTLVLLTFIAVWALAGGVLQIWGAIMLRKEMRHEWLPILSGILSMLFGALLIATPAAGAVALVWTVGWFALLSGILNVIFAFRLRNYARF